ncbi:TetR family transcriptional regulator C-terminal domain-containing protein [Mesorhizobium sp. GR13]|uniref:TetR family transcriptional regulator C-terminal domain-containing protein n=1 Tax=Mesorhizobium sp. GR13 TaxID=2562308 RepID=UPI0010C0528D|nr:TetR family transcriptional regulator C-terminal domain-containing protein [Mesorhizobium sp. GR13]
MRIDLWSAALTHDDIAVVERELYERYGSQLTELLRDVAIGRGCGPEKVAPLADTIMATFDGLWLDWERRHNETANTMVWEAALRWRTPCFLRHRHLVPQLRNVGISPFVVRALPLQSNSSRRYQPRSASLRFALLRQRWMTAPTTVVYAGTARPVAPDYFPDTAAFFTQVSNSDWFVAIQSPAVTFH